MGRKALTGGFASLTLEIGRMANINEGPTSPQSP